MEVQNIALAQLYNPKYDNVNRENENNPKNEPQCPKAFSLGKVYSSLDSPFAITQK